MFSFSIAHQGIQTLHFNKIMALREIYFSYLTIYFRENVMMDWKTPNQRSTGLKPTVE
uniref:Uncharacterized protein n=1 Tax=Arion vulgaris TaxID=1028688 RepID=A0A0B7BYH0_9EUPU